MLKLSCIPWINFVVSSFFSFLFYSLVIYSVNICCSKISIFCVSYIFISLSKLSDIITWYNEDIMHSYAVPGRILFLLCFLWYTYNLFSSSFLFDILQFYYSVSTLDITSLRTNAFPRF